MKLRVTAESHYVTVRTFMDADAWWREDASHESNLQFEKDGRNFRLEIEGPPEARVGRVYENDSVVWNFVIPTPDKPMMSDSHELAD